MSIQHALKKSSLKLLRPLVKVLINHEVSVNDFMDLVKQTYVEVADSEFQLEGRKQSTSRIAVLTGMHRKDVAHFRKPEHASEQAQVEDANARFHGRAARVINIWNNDPTFQNEKGEAADLPIEGDTASFSTLILKHSGSMTVRAMLDEMIRTGSVSQTEEGLIRLSQKAYVPKNSEVQNMHYLGDASSDILNTIAINLENPKENRLQLSTAFDNLPEECIPDLRVFCQLQSNQVIKNLEQWLNQHDRDCNPKVSGTGRVRAGLGIYYIENNEPEMDQNNEN